MLTVGLAGADIVTLWAKVDSAIEATDKKRPISQGRQHAAYLCLSAGCAAPMASAQACR